MSKKYKGFKGSGKRGVPEARYRRQQNINRLAGAIMTKYFKDANEAADKISRKDGDIIWDETQN